MMEWRDVIGFEGEYQVSENGQVRSLDRVHTYVDSMSRKVTRTYKGKIISKREHKFGYWLVTLSSNGESSTHTVHKLVAEAWLGKRPDELMIRHLDGNPKNNHYSNLAYGNQLENMADAVKHGTVEVGESRYNAKLTAAIVKEIREKREAGVSQKRLADEYGLSEVYIHHLVTGKKWAKAPGPIRKARESKVLSAEEREMVVRDRKIGLALKPIAKRYGVSVTQILNILRKHNEDKSTDAA